MFINRYSGILHPLVSQLMGTTVLTFSTISMNKYLS